MKKNLRYLAGAAAGAVVALGFTSCAGRMALTRTPRPAHSVLTSRVICATAPIAMLYAMWPRPRAVRLASEPILTMLPRPAASMRVRLGQSWGVAGELAYELAGVEHVGFAHGPRASVVLMRTNPRVPGFDPSPFFGKGLEIFGGYWFVADRPSGAVPWHAGAGLFIVLGP